MSTLPPPARLLPVLACRCGKALQPAELRWLPQREGDRHPLPRVGCADCAARNRAW